MIDTIPLTHGTIARSRTESADPQLWNNLVSAWVPTLGPTGVELIDIVGKTNGTLTNGANYQMSPSNGMAVELDGDDDYVDFGTIPSNHPLQLNTGSGITVVYQSRQETGGDIWQRVLDKSTAGGGADGWAIYMYPTTLEIQMGVDGLAVLSTVTSAYAPNVWNTVACCYSVNDSSIRRVWVNGVQKLSASDTKAIPNVATGLKLGTPPAGSGREWEGGFGPVLVYNTCLDRSVVYRLTDDILAPFRRRRISYGKSITAPAVDIPALMLTINNRIENSLLQR